MEEYRKPPTGKGFRMDVGREIAQNLISKDKFGVILIRGILGKMILGSVIYTFELSLTLCVQNIFSVIKIEKC
jgi:hypothetical protein